MLNKYTLLLAFILASLMPAVSQVAKGDKFYEQAEYFKAIPYYKKESKSKSSVRKQEAYVKLGNSYKFINDYVNAEDAYRKALEADSGDVAAEVYYNYAQVLKTNNKYQEASVQLANYLRLAPNDENAKKAMKFCNEVKYFMSKPVEYEIKNIESINTDKAEFCPYVSNNKLMFVAERETFDFINYEVNNYDGQPFVHMYVSVIEGDVVKKSKTLSKKINEDYHDGPACLSADGHTLFFTRVLLSDKKGVVNHSKIYTATGSDRNWKDIKPMDINSDDYSVAHPSISADNKYFFFTSNMPGGFGGKDIYMCTRVDSLTWSKPVNLGPDINTSGDEMFPSIRKDGTLFFSSNGLPGFGGLDIYSAKKVEDKWLLERNEGLNINSNTDDFGISFLNDSTGYFSSNRAGGKGNDDIYFYTYKNKSTMVEGTVLMTENLADVARDKKVLLIDEKGNVIDSARTDENGYFSFKNIPADKKYMAVVDEEDPELSNKARYYLAEKNNGLQRISYKMADGKFAFKNLPFDKNGLPELQTDDELVFAGSLRSGEGNETALKNVKLKIVNEFGDVVEETTTNEFGAFAFRNIPADQNYIITIDDGDASLPDGTKITLANKAGKAIKTFYKQKSNFSFKVLRGDTAVLEEMDAEDVNLTMGLYGYLFDQDKKPISNASIRMKEEDGSNEQKLVTGTNGRFNFKKLDANKNYIFEADANDPSLNGVSRIYVADAKGRVYKVVDLTSGVFAFKILEVDKSAMGEFVLDDPTMIEALKKANVSTVAKETKKVKDTTPPKEEPKAEEKPKEEPEIESEISITIVESIYYAYGDFSIGPEGEKILNKAVEALMEYPKLIMEISSHTDSQSSSEFNMNLSRKRAQTAVDYLVSKGISRTRLKATGYGETRLLNHCGEGVQCSDEEHKVNRRTEFKISKPIKH